MNTIMAEANHSGLVETIKCRSYEQLDSTSVSEEDPLQGHGNGDESAFSNTRLEIKKSDSSIGSAVHGHVHEDLTLSKRGIIKNLLVQSFSFVLLYSAYNAFAGLQSTINLEGGLGTVGLCLIYVTLALSTLFILAYTMSRFSFKTTMMVSMVTYILYVCTGFYSTWATVLPASVLIGIGAAHLWFVQQSYMTALARQYSQRTQTSFQHTTDVFFGLFFGMFATTQIWGNLFSSLAFRHEIVNETRSTDIYGANFCPRSVNQTEIHKPPIKQLFIFTGFCVGLGCLAIVITSLCLDNITSPRTPRASIISTLKLVLRHLARSRTQQLLIIPTLYRGFNLGFIIVDFTVAYVSCPLGVRYVGFVMMAFGISSSLVAFVFGKLAKYTGNMALFFAGFVAQFSVGMVALLWEPDPHKSYIMFILAALWSCGFAVYKTTLSVLYSTHFGEESSTAAFSSLPLLESLGHAFAMALSSSVCMRLKLVTLLVAMTLSLLMLAILSWNKRRQNQDVK